MELYTEIVILVYSYDFYGIASYIISNFPGCFDRRGTVRGQVHRVRADQEQVEVPLMRPPLLDVSRLFQAGLSWVFLGRAFVETPDIC